MPDILDSEFAFLTCLERHFPRSHPSLLMGRGDDCALVTWPEKVLISTDLFIENVHFRRSYFSPRDIGHKALAVNLSDIAGMGGTALGFSLGVMAPAGGENDTDAAFWDQLFAGMAGLAGRWNAPLTGGDLSRGSCLGLCITVWGQASRPVPRGGCCPGDVVFVCAASGGGPAALGLARAGLLALEEQGQGARSSMPEAVAAHLVPEPVLEAAPVLAGHSGVNSLMDLSDGLATDLPRLLGAELAPHEGRRQTHGADLVLDPQALHPELLDFCRNTGRDPVREAVLGGEDYCLLGTCSLSAASELAAKLPGFAGIGTVSGQAGIRCNGQALESFSGPGFDHFHTGA